MFPYLCSSCLIELAIDKTIMVWDIFDPDHVEYNDNNERIYGVPRKCLKGHNHFVEDVDVSFDGTFAITASWDKTIRLWDLQACECPKTVSGQRHFEGHTKDVLSVAFSADNRQVG